MSCNQSGLKVIFCLMSLGTAALDVSSYHDHQSMTRILQRISHTNQDLAYLYSIGLSHQGRELWVMELSANRTLTVPNVKLVANIHGNEPVGREILIHLSQHLIVKYREGDPYVKWLLNNAKIHLMPSMNPDGFALANQGLCGLGPGRGNAMSKDLNRNFPDGFRMNYRMEQPETKAVMDWMKGTHFMLSASLHSGDLVVVYPFDNSNHNVLETMYSLVNSTSSSSEFMEKWKAIVSEEGEATSETPDNDVFVQLADVYARNHPLMKTSQCGPKHFPGGITNGAAWYPITGGMQDYNYIFHGCMEITLEISCCKYPSPQELPRHWKDNLQPLLKFLGESQRGIKGLVVEKGSGLPIPDASITVLGRNMTVRTTARGEYWRILLPGRYHIQVEAEGYWSKVVEVWVIEDYAWLKKPTLLNIKLSRRQEQSVSQTPLLTNSPLNTWTNKHISVMFPSHQASYSASTIPTSFLPLHFLLSVQLLTTLLHL